MYSSIDDTKKHIALVQENLQGFRDVIIGMFPFNDRAINMFNALEERGEEHDASKLIDPELSIFDEVTPKLKTLTYGSDEYKQSLADMGPALKHHYENNRHHPEHHKNGIDDMTLVDIIEMFCDWKAAVKRHYDGCIYTSIDINKKRFKMSDPLAKTLTMCAEQWSKDFLELFENIAFGNYIAFVDPQIEKIIQNTIEEYGDY